MIGGVTLGVNSLFDFRGRAPCYIARATIGLIGQRTKLVGTSYTGPQPIAAAKGISASGRPRRSYSLSTCEPPPDSGVGGKPRLGHAGPCEQLHTSRWYGTYGMGIVHVHRLLDVNSRAE